MAEYQHDFARCLVQMDVSTAMRLWRTIAPHLHQPADWDEAEHTMHLARLQMTLLPPEHRAYSEAWLTGRTGPSRIVEAVGVAVGVPVDASASRKSRAKDIEAMMVAAIEQAVRDGVDMHREPDEYRRRMMAARQKVVSNGVL
jgi:hypothetical protein